MTPAEEAELQALEAELGRGKVSKVDELLGGLKHSAISTGHGIGQLLPQALAQHLPSEETYQRSKQFVEESGAMADVGAIGGDILQGLIPGGAFLKGGKLLQKALAARRLPAFGAAAATDIAGNAAFNAAVAPEDKGVAAAIGGAGAAGGRVLNRTLSGPLAPMVTPEARRLMDKGVTMTPGQMVGNRTARGLEEATTGIPIVGDIIKHRSIGGIEDWNKFELNRVLKDAGVSVSTAGARGIDEAKEAITSSIDDIAKKVDVDADRLGEVLDDLAEARKHHSMLNDTQRNQVDKWVELNVKPLLKEHIYIPMAKVRKLDQGLQAQILKARTSKDPLNESLEEAFGEVHRGLRAAFEGMTSPEDATKLQKLFKAEDDLLALERAASKNPSGVFSPAQLKAEYERTGQMLPQSLKDAYATLPKKVPDTGSPSRALLYHAITPASAGAGLVGASQMLGGFGPLAAAAGTAASLYTKPGSKYLASGIKPVFGKKLSQEEMEFAIKLLGTQGLIAAGDKNAP